MGKLIDLTGQRFGRLTVIERTGSDKNKNAVWKCHCDCGNIATVCGHELTNGHTQSCGCLKSEVFSKRNIVHGKRGSRLYVVWISMKNRCTNPAAHNYHRYGGRGITVCNEWLHDFQAFFDWAIANGYDENAPKGQCTIDRIDNDKGYSPDNCRWVDMKVQRHNRSDSRSK